MKGYDVCLAFKVVYHKSYRDFSLLLVSTYYRKDILIDLVMGCLHLLDRKYHTYDFILVMLSYVTDMVYYELVKTTINTAGLAKTIINVIVRHHNLQK